LGHIYVLVIIGAQRLPKSAFSIGQVYPVFPSLLAVADSHLADAGLKLRIIRILNFIPHAVVHLSVTLCLKKN
jgi:hypothetical protein